VTEVAEGGTVALAFQSRHQVRPLRHSGKQLALEADVGEDPLQVLDRPTLVAGRVDRVEADQALQELGGVVHALDATPLGKWLSEGGAVAHQAADRRRCTSSSGRG
jgi:hypothetical protein